MMMYAKSDADEVDRDWCAWWRVRQGLLLERPRFADVEPGVLFKRPDQPGYTFLKIAPLYYVWDFNIDLAVQGKLGGRDLYCPNPELRVEVLGHVRELFQTMTAYDPKEDH